MLNRPRAFACAVASAATLALCACGGGGGVSSDDPASLAPADAPIYVQAVLRPHGALKTNVERLASRISGLDDPTAKLVALIDQGLNQHPLLSGKRLTFARDIEPWLGRRAGLFLEDLQRSDPPAAAIVQTTDPKATQAFIRDSRQRGDTYRSYRGLRYLLDHDRGTAAAVVGRFLLVGNQRAFEDAVDVSKGADSLGDQSDFTDTLDRAPSGSLADAYASFEQIGKAIRAQSPQGAKGFEGAIGGAAGKTALASLIPAADSARLEVTSNASQDFTGVDLRDLIGSLPAGSFVALGVPDLGAIVDRTITQLQDAGVPGVSRSAIERRLSQAGLSLGDITGALGKLAVFAEGTNRATLQGAALITSKDRQKAQKLIAKLTAITGLTQLSHQPGIKPAPVGNGVSISDRRELGPEPLIITTQDGRIVIGYGVRAARQALSGGAGSTLAGDPTFRAAVSALGGSGLSAYVALPGVFRLADALGALRDPAYVKARPYLDKLRYAAIGSSRDGGWTTIHVVVGVR